MAPGIVLLQGPRGALFLMGEVPLYLNLCAAGCSKAIRPQSPETKKHSGAFRRSGLLLGWWSQVMKLVEGWPARVTVGFRG
jgi:hypothetical protein